MESLYDPESAAAQKAAPVEAADVRLVGGKVLLIQDVVPWAAAANQSPLGADVTELECLGEPFDIVTSNLVGVIALNQYREIVIAAAQTQAFYNNLFPGGFIHLALVNWAQQGGILSANLTDRASGPGEGGTWLGSLFLSGVQQVPQSSNNNAVADAAHPIITGQHGGCAGGPIIDVGQFVDLDGWGSSSHGYFINLPAGTQVILAIEEDGAPNLAKPVMVEFPFGLGRAIASMVTNEYRYVGGFVGGSGTLPQNRKLLANEFGYQRFLSQG
ncbi:MAG TPA: hypothetical protein VGK74_17235 [Symbiobacteriaceae bacterium]|jgi:hypothetical protein